MERSAVKSPLFPSWLPLAGTLALAFGMLLAFFATKALSRLHVPFPIPISFDFTPDVRVLVFTVVLAMITGVALEVDGGRCI